MMGMSKEYRESLKDGLMNKGLILSHADCMALLREADERDAFAEQLEIIDKKLAAHDGDVVAAWIFKIEDAERMAVNAEAKCRHLEGKLREEEKQHKASVSDALEVIEELEKTLGEAEKERDSWKSAYDCGVAFHSVKCAELDSEIHRSNKAEAELSRLREALAESFIDKDKYVIELERLRGCGLGEIRKQLGIYYLRSVGFVHGKQDVETVQNSEDTFLAMIASLLQREIFEAFCAGSKYQAEPEDAKSYAQQRMEEIKDA